MGFCTSRNLLLTICILQLVTLFERQVFEFLGFLWIPILVNFFEIIFVIFGFFGAYQYRPKYIVTYILWHVFWLAWNVFIVCLYLDIGILDHKESKVLKVDQWSESWWMKNGPGCRVELNVTHPHPSLENVVNCYVDYRYVEIFQAGLQSTLALLGLLTGFCLSRTFLEEDDSSSPKSRKNAKRMSLYSIEFSPPHDRHADSDDASLDYDDDGGDGTQPATVSPKPMTPRRVKRRSVMQRGTTSRHSTTSRRHNNNNNHTGTAARSSTRSSRRSMQNPVTRLMEQQQKIQQQQYDMPAASSPMDLNYHDYHTRAASSNNLLPPPTWQQQQQHVHPPSKGHANPTYQQSSSQSLNEHDDFEELYTNRPASARSSYSNFHGTRAINYVHSHHHHQPLPPPPPHAANYHGHATPQVPQKMNTHRASLRSRAFLNNGPPAYTPHTAGGHPASPSLDSETAI